MTDLIDRQQLLQHFDNCLKTGGFNAYIVAMQCYVEQMPTIELKRGEWVNDNDPMYPYSCHCSECGETALTKEETSYDYVLSNYCPNCGADMRGDSE